MLNIDFTFLFAAVNLLILYFFLRKFLFGRVTQFMDNRAEAIQNDIEKAKADKAEGAQYAAEQKRLMQEATDQRNQFVEAARQKANAFYDETVEGAKAQAARIIAKADADIEREREKMVAELKDEVASLALAAASKVMQANMDTETNRSLVDEFLKEEGAA